MIKLLSFLRLLIATSALQPNVLMVMMEDLFDVTARQDLREEIPHIVEFTGDSIRYTNMHASVSQSGPSRLSILTGKYPINFKYNLNGQDRKGFYNNDYVESIHSHPEPTVLYSSKNVVDDTPIQNFPTWLKDNHPEYRIYGVSKISYTCHGITGVTRCYHGKTYTSGLMMPFDKLVTLRDKGPSLTTGTEFAQKIQPPYERKSTDYDAAVSAMAIIDDHMAVSPTDPFFMIVGLQKPSINFRFEDNVDTQLKTTEFFTGNDDQSIPQYQKTLMYHPICKELDRRDVEYYRGFPEKLTFYPSSRIKTSPDIPGDVYRTFTQNIREMYIRSVKQNDIHFGRLLDKLRQHNIYDDTIIVLTSTNGFHLGQHGRWCDKSLYDGSTKVPYLIKPPNYSGGTRDNSDAHSLVDNFRLITEHMRLPFQFVSDYKRMTVRKDLPPHATSVGVICLADDQVSNNGCFYAEYKNYDYISLSLRTNKWRYVELRGYNRTTSDIDWYNAPVDTQLFKADQDIDQIYDMTVYNTSYSITEMEMNQLKYLLYEDLDVCNGHVGIDNCNKVQGGYCKPDGHGYCITNSDLLTASPSKYPTRKPTERPTDYPTVPPSPTITSAAPTGFPSRRPTGEPSKYPSPSPTEPPSPTMPPSPTISLSPTTLAPTPDPTPLPTVVVTTKPPTTSSLQTAAQASIPIFAGGIVLLSGLVYFGFII